MDVVPDDVPQYPENNKAFKAACLKANATALEFIKNHKVESVIIALSHGYKKFVEWNTIVSALEKYDIKTLYIVGPVPQWDPSLPHAHATQLGYALPVNINTFLRRSVIADNDFLYNLQLNPSGTEVVKISPFRFLCHKDNACNYIVPDAPDDDKLIVFDYGHLSYSGSIYLTREIFSKYFD